MNNKNSPSVAGCIVCEPFIDLTMSHSSWQGNQDKCVLPYVPCAEPGSISRVYFGPTDGVAADILSVLRLPLLSPLFADVTVFPPMQIQVGEDDVLHDEAKAFAARIPTAELIVYPGINHYTLLRGRAQLDLYYGNMRKFSNKVFGSDN
ncbi:hypothetical protein GGI21_004771 [Coemansia aciculifera]|nr:hypothetical protein GGI21_004771 [Coemansia aciculifera]